ncbi:hypothetical protein H8356DRAFT_1085768 [Neocallimastix lanati (nom. inval.)]|uniref:Uncharacterized protein n=1 Tax=Neocallimastix californiae TaxID=1754190 RepID=A0A1Y2EYY3_9FUNG|nr:hypothetical protein H8356DRAFT_1085768 [Neocallimastix sp. JGI-2020a]ORY76474.1 hypothetical protein LY90DRAFT_501800 [Neocallimastix californiae]|eukprot:ORY76474.1 hypothetical protein LY90DRAFT_501800 [Neocallimastix californiae]
MTSSRENLSESKEKTNSLKSGDDNDKKIYSKNDLNHHLDEIKTVLRDKERDLSLAAEIGQQLLEANTVLKKAYEELFIQNQDVQNKLQRYEQLTTVHSGRSSPVQSSSSPLSPRYRAMRSRNNSPTPPRSRRGARNLSLPPSIRLDGTANSSPSLQAKANELSESDIEDISNSLKDQYLEKIKNLENSLSALERHNEELKHLLEKKKEEVKDIQIQNSKLLLIKDGEVYDLKQELESLMIKAKKLEMEKKTLKKENQRQATELDRIETIDQEYIKDLLGKVNRLDASLKKMESTKEELEKNIENVMVEKLEYQNKCKSLDKKLQDYLYYKHLHDTQAHHIQELNQTIEQQRMQIQNLDFQLYNLSMSSINTPDIKYSEKYVMENPYSIEGNQKSNTSYQRKLSVQSSDIESMYDPDTIVITAKRNINSSTNNTSQSIQSSDPDLTISSNGLGKKSLYTELESTDWYDKRDNDKESDIYNDGTLVRSSSEGVISSRNKLLSRKRQPYHHQYQSSYSLIGRKQSSSSNDEALTLIDKANQSFAGNNNIEKLIKPQILKNDVNSYEVLINTIENEFKNSEEIQNNSNSLENKAHNSGKDKDNLIKENENILNKLDISDDKDDTNGKNRFVSESLSQKQSNLLQNPLFKEHIRKISFDTIFRAFELSKFQSTHLITDSNYSSNSKNRKNKKNGTINNNYSSSIFIQEINDKDVNGNDISTNDNDNSQDTTKNNASSFSNTTKFFMPNPMNASIISNAMIPINSTTNKEFNNLIKNFHMASPITPLIANINLNNAIKEGVSSSNKNNVTPSSTSKDSFESPKTKSKNKSKSKGKSTTNIDMPKSTVSLKNKPLFGTSKKLLSHKMDLSLMYKEDKNDTPTNTINYNDTTLFDSDIITKEEAEASAASASASVTFTNPNMNETKDDNGNYSGGDLFSLLKEKQSQMMEDSSGNHNGIFSSSVNGSSILASNTIMNNQVMLDQYRNTLNHYSSSGSAILQVLIDSWLRFLNGFVGYGSNINYDINNMEYGNESAYQRGRSYTHRRSPSSFSDDSFTTSDPGTTSNTSATPSTSSSSQNIKALSRSIRTKKL